MVIVDGIKLVCFVRASGADHHGHHHCLLSGQRILGLSKLSRIAGYFASRCQNQERTPYYIAGFLEKFVEPLGVNFQSNVAAPRATLSGGSRYIIG
jgi:GTP cyclohydrolase I